MSYLTLDSDALNAELDGLRAAQARLQRNNQQLDLTRGKPAADQLALSNELDGILQGDYRARDGTDTRNYGGLYGIDEARELGAELLGVEPQSVMAAGNSSLQLMHAAASVAVQSTWRGERPTMLCPVPGYDRHFALCDSLGLDMQAVALTESGPDMDQIEALVEADADIGGIWCVPRFSNPTGCVYSDATVERIARLPTRARHPGFTVFWDNAYAVHALSDDAPSLAALLPLAEAAGTADHMRLFASTSKITFAGAGVAFVAGSAVTLAALESYLGFMTIGPDKINQLRTARFLHGRLHAHMADHARLLRPKFERVQAILAEDLGRLEIATWTQPLGGYFVSLDTLPGLASEVVRLAGASGVKLTRAGATFPNGQDPQDRNIRIAPTYPDLEELDTAMRVLTNAIRLASLTKLQSA
ncbi:MAG: aminotransferase class I/II-fold pyridoxal phosphate-dependent enzyme [Pseudomonadota bacterium]